MKGFVDYNIDIVIKFGGSLLKDPIGCKKTIYYIQQLSKKHRIVVFPGGGPTDNTIEDIDKTVHFMPITHHYACAKAQDQTGLMLSDRFFGLDLEAIDNLSVLENTFDKGKIPVLLPSMIIHFINPFEQCWEITSDSMAAWLCWILGCHKLIILTDVDGIYELKHIGNPSYLIKKITTDQLSTMGHTSVDECLSEFVKANGIIVYVCNGFYPERLLNIYNDKFIGTIIGG